MRRAALVTTLGLLAGCASLLGLEDPVGDRCRPFFAEDCDVGETCEFEVQGELIILDCQEPGAGTPGSLCDFGDCAAGLTCWQGVCRTFCSEPGTDCPDAAEGECAHNANNYFVCDSECDVLAPASCGIERICTIQLNNLGNPIPVCQADGWQGIVDYLDECTYLSECLPGLACYDTDPADGVDLGVCVHLCRDADACPDEGTTCEQVFTAPLHDTAIGLCPPP